MAVAPVVDWRLYGMMFSVDIWILWLITDATYTERYMGLPGDDGYPLSSLISDNNAVRVLGNGKLLLVHGTSDGIIWFVI